MSDKERQRQRRQKEYQQGITRRKFLRYSLIGGGLVFAGGLGAAAKYFLDQSAITSPSGSSEQFSGEIEDTKQRKAAFEQEIGDDESKFLANAEKIISLAQAYLSTQMSAELPDLKDQYQIDKIKSRYIVLDEDQYKRYSEQCGRKTTENDAGRFVVRDDKVLISPQKIWNGKRDKSMATNTLFRIALHEGIHSVAKRRDFPGGSSEQNIPLVFDYTHGLVAYEYETGIDDFGNRCDKSAFIMLEEAVVEDQTLRLLAKLSTNGKVYGDADYVQIVKDYNLKILPLFNNDFQVGLRFHQTSDPFSFFRQIGTKFGVQDPNWQAAEGLKFTQQFFPQ